MRGRGASPAARAGGLHLCPRPTAAQHQPRPRRQGCIRRPAGRERRRDGETHTTVPLSLPHRRTQAAQVQHSCAPVHESFGQLQRPQRAGGRTVEAESARASSHFCSAERQAGTADDEVAYKQPLLRTLYLDTFSPSYHTHSSHLALHITHTKQPSACRRSSTLSSSAVALAVWTR